MFNKIIIAVLISCSLASAKDKETKEMKTAGICVALEGKDLTPTEKVICLRAKMIQAQEEQKKDENELKKLATPAEKKAIKEEEKAEKRQAELKKQIAEATARANIEGCPPGSVTVYPSAMLRQTFGRLAGEAFVPVRIVNNRHNNESVNINDADGSNRLVSNLCPGGSATAYRVFDVGNEGYYGYSTWIATGLQSRGIDTRQVQVYYDKFAGANQPQVWDVHLQK